MTQCIYAIYIYYGKDTFPPMIIPKNIEDVSKLVADGVKVFDALVQLRISPLEFFKHLESSQEDMNLFSAAKAIAVERFIDDIGDDIANAADKFELDKAIAKTRASQWLAEKIIPKTYGQKLEVSNNMTIDIRGVLALANARVDSIEVKRTPEPAKLITEEDLLG